MSRGYVQWKFFCLSFMFVSMEASEEMGIYLEGV